MPGHAVPSKNLHLRRGILPTGSWKPAPDSGICRTEQGALRSYLWADGIWDCPGETGEGHRAEQHWARKPHGLVWSGRCGLTLLKAFALLLPDQSLTDAGAFSPETKAGPRKRLGSWSLRALGGKQGGLPD